MRFRGSSGIRPSGHGRGPVVAALSRAAQRAQGPPSLGGRGIGPSDDLCTLALARLSAQRGSSWTVRTCRRSQNRSSVISLPNCEELVVTRRPRSLSGVKVVSKAPGLFSGALSTTSIQLKYAEYGRADERTRTADLLITSELLYLLSYVGLFRAQSIPQGQGAVT